MRLNPDCIRDVLLTLEGRMTVDCDMGVTRIGLGDLVLYPELEKQSREDIIYSVYQLSDAGYIELASPTQVQWQAHAQS